jgi:hypothetical protein
MPTTPRSQSALAADPNFQKRLSALLLSEALVIADEPTETPNHTMRRALAQSIITQPAYQTQNLSPAIANGTNLVAANTTYNFEAGATETSATDAEIRSQISSLWDTLAGA